MHPALSIIVFTTLSGAGYGLLFWLGVFAAGGLLPPDRGLGAAGLGIALVAVTAGLLASLLHLGHPERAWRALSQWRSSWLSREGLASTVTYLPAGLFAIGWLGFGETGGVWRVPALLAALGAVATVVCTAYIYRSLAPVQRWSNGWVLPNYLTLAASTGSLWLAALTVAFGTGGALFLALPALLTLVAAALKLGYWRFIDRSGSRSTAASATGLGAFGEVRLFEAPHTAENYLLKEMGFRIARKHARKLRRIAFQLAFVLPFLLMLVALASTGWGRLAAAVLAAPLATLGVLVERWLFFAEAKHTVTLYYGASRA